MSEVQDKIKQIIVDELGVDEAEDVVEGEGHRVRW